MLKQFGIAFLSLLFFISSIAQKTGFTSAKDRTEGYKKREQLKKNSVVNGIKFQSIGPSVMSGRVVDVEVDPADPSHFYAAYASGGLWETMNNGTTFTPIFDNEMVMTIGDIAVDWKNKIIYVGTGENNSSRSSYSGTGVFKSEDNGKTWQHLGLEETHHIGRIVLHPSDKNIFWVAAIGHLFTNNKERGVFKTTDGGKTWKHVLFINEQTGVIDLVLNPADPNTLYAASWQRERKPWNFTESGPGSGIYKSNNGGEKWELVTSTTSGFPTGDGVGRIGISLCKAKPETIYAVLDNQFRRKEESKPKTKTDELTKEMLRKMSKEEFLKLDEKKIEAYLKNNGFPKKYTVSEVKNKIRSGMILPVALADYLEDANSLLFDTPVTGAEIYRSDDGGKTWKKTHDEYIDDLVYTYGYYFGQIRVSETNPDEIYVAAFVIIKSEDGGKTFRSINGDNQHVDHHALWINPEKKGHLINGNDGGINISYDDGKTWIKNNQPAVGQFYTVNVDMEEPYNVYGGLQDNGVWYGPSDYSAGSSWQMEGHYPYKTVLGGDGMQVAIDPRDNHIIYTGYQFGHYYRMNKKTQEEKYITPKHELGERPLRWNWQSPIHLSKHNNDVIYFCANKVFRSLNKGDDFKSISGDLTAGGKQGDVAYGTITCIHESPMKFGLLYTGSDDGLVYVSKDGGNNWTNVTGTLPKDLWVREVQASAFSEGRVYVALNGHTYDDFNSYLFVSEDYGKTWKKLGSDLPFEPINVVKEDPENENIIYIGTDHGIYVSLNRGNSFMAMSNGLPAVAVHDLVIHPRDKELVAATHGRSIYKASVKHLQLLNDSVMAKPVHVFSINEVKHSGHWGMKGNYWEKEREPAVMIPVWIKGDCKVSLRVSDDSGKEIYNETKEYVQGINYLEYHLTSAEENEKMKKSENGKIYLIPGKYTIKITACSVSGETEFKITDK
ncbi:MAG: WD40/YVTN/BNR-like repeat-containing protein [Bacteroidota bacterium]